MDRKEKETQGKFSRVKQWTTLSCACGYAVELCHQTTGFILCPLCLKSGTERPLERRINRV